VERGFDSTRSAVTPLTISTQRLRLERLSVSSSAVRSPSRKFKRRRSHGAIAVPVQEQMYHFKDTSASPFIPFNHAFDHTIRPKKKKKKKRIRARIFFRAGCIVIVFTATTDTCDGTCDRPDDCTDDLGANKNPFPATI